MPPPKPALDRSYRYPPEVLELLVETLPRLIKTKAELLEFFAETGAPKELLAHWRTKLRQDRSSVSKYHMARSLLRGLNALGDEARPVRHQVLRRLARHADFSAGWEDDCGRAQELVARIRELAGETDADTWHATSQEALTRQATRETYHARLKHTEHRREALEALKRDLYRAFRVADPSERRALLGSVLPRLFTCHDVTTRRAPAAPESDAAVLIDFDGAPYLVELRWSERPLDFKQLAPHLVAIYGGPDRRGLFISSSGFTDQAVQDMGSILPQRPCVLCHLEEIVLLLEEGRDLKELLRAKVRAAETEQKPFVRGL